LRLGTENFEEKGGNFLLRASNAEKKLERRGSEVENPSFFLEPSRLGAES
jgi:hypothetical protein